MYTKKNKGKKRGLGAAAEGTPSDLIEKILDDVEDTRTVAEKRFGLRPGRKKAIQTVEELDERLEEYLNDLGRWKLPTKSGLCFALGIARETLNNYEKDVLFRDTLREWYQVFEDAWVQNLARNNATGTIFYLKNAFSSDFKDRFENDNINRSIHYVLPREIAEKHNVQIIEPEQVEAPKEQLEAAPVAEASPVVETENLHAST